MRYLLLAALLLGLAVAAPAQARPCWWNGHEWVCRYPEHRPFWWRHEHERRWNGYERHHDPRYWGR